ncbi:hypothetical protein AN958_08914 [Leucoagaricus sp. SymC.cos]|nr:hypothetical protein AN958_08914 [Leucoagaricus sp. SymC.cos]
MITVSAFDGDVWIRDIDSSPSPFPIPILLAFLKPRPLKWWHHGRHSYDIPTTQPVHSLCVESPCRCPMKPTRTLHHEVPLSPTEENRTRKAKSLPHTLIRVPNAAEQRASIAVSFEVVGRFN